MAPLLVSRVVSQTGDQLVRTELAGANLVDGSEEREVGLQAAGRQHVVHLGCGLGALQLLAVQHLPLQLHDGLLPLHEGLGDLPVPAAVAGGDEVGHPAGLEVGGLTAARVESLPVLDHLLQAQADDGGLGVVPHLEAVAEARGAGHDVLESTAYLHYVGVTDHTHPGVPQLVTVTLAWPGLSPEVLSLEEKLVVGAELQVLAPDGRLTELLLGHLVSEVRPHENTAGDADRVCDQFADQLHPTAGQNLETLRRAES